MGMVTHVRMQLKENCRQVLNVGSPRCEAHRTSCFVVCWFVVSLSVQPICLTDFIKAATAGSCWKKAYDYLITYESVTEEGEP